MSPEGRLFANTRELDPEGIERRPRGIDSQVRTDSCAYRALPVRTGIHHGLRQSGTVGSREAQGNLRAVPEHGLGYIVPLRRVTHDDQTGDPGDQRATPVQREGPA